MKETFPSLTPKKRNMLCRTIQRMKSGIKTRLGVKRKMVTEKQTNSANYLRIITQLRHLLNTGKITQKEYTKAKKYYKKLTGADIVIAD